MTHHLRLLCAAGFVMLATLGWSRTSKAESYVFTASGSGIDLTGVIQVADTGPLGAATVTGINGYFTDTNNGIAGAITGLDFAPAPTFNASPAPPNTFNAPAFTDAGFSYDNLFWANGNSPAVCEDALVFFGGYFDVYGLAFNVAGGYTVDLWSDGGLGGYQLNDSLNGVPFFPSNMEGLAYAVDVDATPTPEPATLTLLGTGVMGLAGLVLRKRRTA